jgi:hypothetical protein
MLESVDMSLLEYYTPKQQLPAEKSKVSLNSKFVNPQNPIQVEMHILFTEMLVVASVHH